jgi:predicted esterase
MKTMKSVSNWSGVVLVALLLASMFALPGQAAQSSSSTTPEETPPGRVIQKVICKTTPTQSYALYLPSNYSSTRSWPLLAAFDPGARGNSPVEHFKEAAERYGYIVCGSNNSRNGPLPASADAAKAMLEDVSARFSIDARRVYLTGFSGGARAATAIAVWLTGHVAGVIGCGAGLANGLEPSSLLPFSFYGTVGTEDFNYPEMKQLDRLFDSANVTHRIHVFDGGHSWPPADVSARALEWMELQAMKSGRRSRDDSFIDHLFKDAQDSAIADEAAGRFYEAYGGYSGISADFKGLRDVSQFEKKAALLKDSKAVKQAVSKNRDQENEQRRRVNEIFDKRANAQKWSNDPPTQEPFLYDLKRILSDLKRRSEEKEKTLERSLARRVLNEFTITVFEQSTTLIQTKKYDLAASNLAIDSELMPDNSRLLYNLACAYALKGDKRRAIETLNKAVKKGFANAAELDRNAQLDAIREDAGFKRIVEELKQKQ